MVVTIPATTPPGQLPAACGEGRKGSNPTVPHGRSKGAIATVTTSGMLTTINGTGFGGFAAGSGTKVSAVGVNERTGKLVTFEGVVKSWTETKIVVGFRYAPQSLTVNSVFGQPPATRPGKAISDGRHAGGA